MTLLLEVRTNVIAGVPRSFRYTSEKRSPKRTVPADGDVAEAVLVGTPSPLTAGPTGNGIASVVVPTHNDGANIDVLLARLVAEPEVGEVVVVASGCDDETVPKVLESAAASEGRVRLYVEAERTGKAAAVNFGLRQVSLPVAVLVSGDVLPDPGAIGRLVAALETPGVGLAGGRPVPVNSTTTAVGHAVHLMWRLHHRLALHQPKLGEMLALRSEAIMTLPRTSVDEACFQALFESAGWLSSYVPEAVVANRGPCTFADFLKQRRQIHAGHLWLRHRQHYTVPSLQPRLLAGEMWKDLTADLDRMRPRRLAWTVGTVGIEAWARGLARLDYLRGREKHVWDMVASTKDLAPDARPANVVHGSGQQQAQPSHAVPRPGPAHMSLSSRPGVPDAVSSSSSAAATQTE